MGMGADRGMATPSILSGESSMPDSESGEGGATLPGGEVRQEVTSALVSAVPSEDGMGISAGVLVPVGGGHTTPGITPVT